MPRHGQSQPRTESEYEVHLRVKITQLLESQGFSINPHLRPNATDKVSLRKMHEAPRKERLQQHKEALIDSFDIAKEFSINGSDLRTDGIRLELKEVKSGSIEEKLYFWWNLMWWSLPYEPMIGRQMRFLLWDQGHDAPFGLIGLQSPLLRMSCRDNYLNLNARSVPYWVNQSLTGQRVGALPPYNQLLGSKMVGYALASNELRNAYSSKYAAKFTLLEGRKLPARLLFITTTSAYGRSSVYERLRYRRSLVCKFLGFTSGFGTFQFPDSLYEELLAFLTAKGVDTKRGYGTGPSRKLKLLNQALSRLGVGSYVNHRISRGVYLFPHASNLRQVLHGSARPRWFRRPFLALFDHWMERWCNPRSIHVRDWKDFDSRAFLRASKAQLGLKTR